MRLAGKLRFNMLRAAFPIAQVQSGDSVPEGVVGRRFVGAVEGKIGILAIDVPRFRLWEV